MPNKKSKKKSSASGATRSESKSTTAKKTTKKKTTKKKAARRLKHQAEKAAASGPVKSPLKPSPKHVPGVVDSQAFFPYFATGGNRIYTNKEKQRIALDMLERYTGSHPRLFRKQIILTNFDYYIERFHNLCGDERTKGSAMTAVHSHSADVSIVNFSIGSPTAALIIELLSTVNPKAVLLLGMCGGLHRSLKVGDFIIPTAAIRDEGASKHFMPARVPALPTFKVQKFVSQMLVEKGHDYRTGVIHTTDYRFWEFDEQFKADLYQERALAIDMECATLFITGFVSKVPIGSLLLVSDLPLRRGGIKTKKSAGSVFRQFTDLHLDIGIKAMSEIAERGEHIRHYKW